jgi:hypothetical protein
MHIAKGVFMRSAIIAFFVAVFAAASPVSAQTSTPADAQPPAENIAAARDLVQVMKLTDQFKALLPTIVQAMKPAFVQGDPQKDQQFDAILPAINSVVSGRVNELADSLAIIYARNFSVAEIHDISAFYLSPTGQRLLAQQPAIARESLAVSQQWAQTLRASLTDAIKEELSKREHAN